MVVQLIGHSYKDKNNFLTFSKFKIQLEALDPVFLPSYKGSMLRGAFGHAFREVACSNRANACKDCSQRFECAYSYVFETPPPSSAEVLRKYPHAPHPFIIEPPLEEKNEFLPSDILSYHLVLIGRAIKYLPIFILTFERMAEKGLAAHRTKFMVGEVFYEDGESSLPIYSSKDKIIHQDLVREKNITLSDFIRQEENFQLELYFLTPTRLKYEERIANCPEFHIVIRNLLRRVSLMNYYHGNGEKFEIDYPELIQKAQKVKLVDSKISWYDWERYSSRQNRKIKMGGFVGRARYQGDFGPFYGLLKMGEIIHIGKGAVFGMGKYILKEI